MAIVSTGIVVTFASGFTAELVEVSGPNMSRVDVNVSHHLSPGWHEYLPGKLVEGGQMPLTISYDPATAPPISDVAELVTFSHPDDDAHWSFQGYLNQFNLRGTLDINYVAECQIKVAGAINFVGADPTP